MRHATTGSRVRSLNRSRSRRIWPHAATPPPGLFTRSTTARTHGSHAAASSFSRNSAIGFSPTESGPTNGVFISRPSTSMMATRGAPP